MHMMGVFVNFMTLRNYCVASLPGHKVSAGNVSKGWKLVRVPLVLDKITSPTCTTSSVLELPKDEEVHKKIIKPLRQRGI